MAPAINASVAYTLIVMDGEYDVNCFLKAISDARLSQSPLTGYAVTPLPGGIWPTPSRRQQPTGTITRRMALAMGAPLPDPGIKGGSTDQDKVYRLAYLAILAAKKGSAVVIRQWHLPPSTK